ncbi:sigma-54 interaction domain-containing protein [Aminipila sp.]|uniref:sigma-54 interaction domain-containing protein n=1 Tax=Aminipila sp. TaxID=2060095 RepID=UPI00289C2AE3|nr:sigma 54-interacting transcriptional regulator [Aminipila sp.]
MTRENENLLKICKSLNIKNDSASEELTDNIISEIEKIKQENYELNAFIEESADSIHIADGNGVTLRVNQVFEKAAGLTRDKIIGKNVSLLEGTAYYPSIAKIAIKEKRKLTMLQWSSTGVNAIVTSTPIFNEKGRITRVVTNGRLVKELVLLNEYFNNLKNNRELKPEAEQSEFIYKNRAMQDLMNLVEHIAMVESGIIITGESGTGKSRIAKYIHHQSPRCKQRFVEINCAAIPESLMESELFGYEMGAFTGAKKGGKQGLIELANKGTLFLDEIGDMPLSMQSKLLQVIQNRQITRVGGETPRQIDVQIISATHKNLENMIKEGTFRLDLYYRLNVVQIHIPALRERFEDIPPLIEYFIKKFNQKYEKSIIISNEVINIMGSYEWPGNIRQLENFVEKLVIMNQTGLVTMEDLSLTELVEHKGKEKPVSFNQIGPLKEALEETEKQLILNAYQSLNSSYKVAKALNISQSAAHRKIQKYWKGK